MTTTRPEEDDTRTTAQAIEWLHRLEAEPRQETADEFAVWLKASPLHLPEFLIQAEIDETLRRARARRGSRQVESAATHEVYFPAAAVIGATRPRRVLALLAVLMLLLVVWICSNVQIGAYRTGAVAAVVQLSGGSRATIFPNTQLSEKSLAGFSHIEVTRGGGEFHLRHRLWQRFRVRAGSALITAMGTDFNVLLRPNDRTGVYVTAGDVRVDGSFQRIRLRQGESVEVAPNGVIGNIQAARPAHAAAAGGSAAQREWSNRTLAAIADEINRRSRLPQIEVIGPARERRFRGDVPLDDPQAWVNALATYPELQMDRQPEKVTIRVAGVVQR